MAHGVTPPAIVVHQALHGYMDGHRLLASSISLKPRDAKLVATLSDASGSTANLEDAGYLTGYPLREAGLYALAKTWPAPEMPRPGCVWTHTLLVDFADLAAVQELAFLAHLFVRPREGDVPGKKYGVDISPGPGALVGAVAPRADANPELLSRLLWALYHQPQERIFSTEGGPEERDEIAFALWSQQWPRLRRSFRFCTLVSSDRSGDGSPFDLQFGSKEDRSLRGRLGKLFDADREPIQERSDWLDAGLRDLLHAGSLRVFLRALGAELEGGRELFRPLSELHEVLNTAGTKIECIRKGAALLEGPLRAAEAREVRAQLLHRLGEIHGDLDEALVMFSMRNFHLIADDDLARIAPHFGSVLWRQDPGKVVRMLAASAREKTLAKHAIASLPTQAILKDLASHPELASPLLHERPDLLSEAALWAAEGLQPMVVEAVRAMDAPAASVIEAAIEGAAAATVRPLCEQWGREIVLSVLTGRFERRHADRSNDQESRWFSGAATPNALATLLSRGESWRLTTLCALARLMQPDDPLNDYGDDPVYTALRHTHGELTATSSLFLRSWVLARALGHRSRSQAELFAFGFEQVYLAALGSRLPDEAWRLLDGRLPNSSFWGDWDRGRRLRAGVLSAFVERDLDAGTFGRLLPASEELFAELVSDASWLWRGRGYLRQVKRALKDADPQRYAARIATLKRTV